MMNTQQTQANSYQQAIFAGGCFWCMEPGFDRLQGVIKTEVGYTGGQLPSPSYVDVSSGKSGHVEAIRVEYDPKLVSYEKLLEVYWENIDPTDEGGQFADRGSQYQTVIFYSNDAQKNAAEQSKEAIGKKLNKTITTRILPAQVFYMAEEYHQDYYKKHSTRYDQYKNGSGRVKKLEELWGKKPH
ncbi:MAG: peptide-methionine (S)-S-oxide reductase MsrA [Alphaproteobacteria bacterium]